MITSRERVKTFTGMTVVEMAYEDGEVLRERLEAANGTVYAEIIVGGPLSLEQLRLSFSLHTFISDRNVWREIRLGPAMSTFQGLAGTLAAAISIIAAVKLIGYIRAFGATLGIAQLSLLLELAANLVRLVRLPSSPASRSKI